MIGYATLGTNDVDKARGFYDALLGSLGAGRIMEFGDDLGGFTMWGTSWDKPGIAVTRPYNGNDAVAGNGNMIAITVDARAKVDALHAKALELGAIAKDLRGFAAKKDRRRFTVPISVISTAISFARSASAAREASIAHAIGNHPHHYCNGSGHRGEHQTGRGGTHPTIGSRCGIDRRCVGEAKAMGLRGQGKDKGNDRAQHRRVPQPSRATIMKDKPERQRTNRDRTHRGQRAQGKCHHTSHHIGAAAQRQHCRHRAAQHTARRQRPATAR